MKRDEGKKKTLLSILTTHQEHVGNADLFMRKFHEALRKFSQRDVNGER